MPMNFSSDGKVSPIFCYCPGFCRSRAPLERDMVKFRLQRSKVHFKGVHLRSPTVAKLSLQDSAHAMNSIKDATPPFLIPIREPGT
jgi:hypothetical protein